MRNHLWHVKLVVLATVTAAAEFPAPVYIQPIIVGSTFTVFFSVFGLNRRIFGFEGVARASVVWWDCFAIYVKSSMHRKWPCCFNEHSTCLLFICARIRILTYPPPPARTHQSEPVEKLSDTTDHEFVVFFEEAVRNPSYVYLWIMNTCSLSACMRLYPNG